MLQFLNSFLHCIPIKKTFHSMFLQFFLLLNWIETDRDSLRILKLSLCLLYLLYVIHSIHTYNHWIEYKLTLIFHKYKNYPFACHTFHMSSILYILITTWFAFLIWIQWYYSYWNRVRIEADIPWILKINKIHQNIPHLEYFPKREGHPKCNAAIHPIPPPNGCGKGGIINNQYTRPQISYFRTENQC